MNGSGKDRYSSGFEKVSKRLKLIYPCAICGEREYSKLECHHKDGNKKNNSIENLIVLCIKDHRKIHNNLISLPDTNYKSGFSVKAARYTTSIEDWFDSKLPLKLLPYLPSKIANDFRKKHIKGFVSIGGCNFYIGLNHKGLLIGVLGFSIPDYGDYDLLMKADTTPQDFNYSTDLLLYVLRTKEVKTLLEDKFSRQINTVYSMCFSQHKQINRYRKHGEKIQEKKKVGGYDLGYLFKLGTIPSLKAAKAQWMQKHKI